MAAGDFVALDAWHINMLSRLPDCSVVLGWVRSNSGWGRVTAGREGGFVGYDVRIPEVRVQLLSAHAAQWFGVVEKPEMLATDLKVR